MKKEKKSKKISCHSIGFLGRRVFFWCRKREEKLLVIVGVLTSAAAGFVLGFVLGNKPEPPTVVKVAETVKVVVEKEKSANVAEAKASDIELAKETCRYVGSKKSDKYYPPNCPFARRISPENLRCFVSDEDAQSKGYRRSSSC